MGIYIYAYAGVFSSNHSQLSILLHTDCTHRKQYTYGLMKEANIYLFSF